MSDDPKVLRFVLEDVNIWQGCPRVLLTAAVQKFLVDNDLVHEKEDTGVEGFSGSASSYRFAARLTVLRVTSSAADPLLHQRLVSRAKDAAGLSTMQYERLRTMRKWAATMDQICELLAKHTDYEKFCVTAPHAMSPILTTEKIYVGDY